jgi:hypothetical protein
MSLPELTKKMVEARLAAFCDRRVPPHVRDEVRLAFRIDGDIVLLLEVRPHFQDSSRRIEIPIAQFRFVAASMTWQLYYPDRNTKWHQFKEESATADLERLISAVDADRTGIFWG